MSGDDLLARATRAMRDTTAPDQVDADALESSGVAATTLSRIEASMRAEGMRGVRRRRVNRWFVVPMAASFVVFAAWASASGQLSRWMSLSSHQDAEHAAYPAPPPTPPPPTPPPTTPPPAEVPVEVEPAIPPPTPAPSPTIAKKRPPAPEPSADVDALYRDAHEAHFIRRDPAAALAAWDRYLAAAGPSARFTLEARYNRGLSLVRLGRRDEAARALRPFADGEYGGYRRDEATQLLQTLEN